VALDVRGPMSTEDIGGNMWFWGGVCYKTSTIFGNVMKHKSDNSSTWKSMISSVKSYGYKISRLRIDNDTVLLPKEFTLVCETEGIAMERVVPYSHGQLSKIERQWRTLVDRAKTLLLVAKLPDRFWGHAFLATWCTSEIVPGHRDLTGSPWSSSPGKLLTLATCAYAAAQPTCTLMCLYGRNSGTRHGTVCSLVMLSTHQLGWSTTQSQESDTQPQRGLRRKLDGCIVHLSPSP